VAGDAGASPDRSRRHGGGRAGRANRLVRPELRITTGLLEGTNNKIQVLKRRSYGFRDTEFFKLEICALHETRYELVG